MPLQLTHHQSETDLLQARRCLMDAGDVPPGLVDDTLRQSWLRSRHAGLSPVDVATEPPLCSTTDLRHTLASEHDLEDSLSVRIHDQLHTKGILLTRSLLMGSMNLTYNGMTINDEWVEFSLDPSDLSRTRLEFARYGEMR